MKRIIFFAFIALVSLMLCSCFLLKPAITLTIYNSTRVDSGALRIIFGNYENEYADGEQNAWSPSFPLVVTIPDATACANYIVIAEFGDLYYGDISWGMVLLDTRIGKNIETSMDLMLYRVDTGNADDFELDDDFDSASVIQAGEYQARSLSAIDVDFVSFYAASGSNYTIETIVHEGAWTNLTIYDDPGHTELSYDENSGDDGSKVSWTASYTGVCYIKVDNTSDSTGYGLVLSSYTAGNSMLNAIKKLDEWSRQ